jgi:hypothetical protein
VTGDYQTVFKVYARAHVEAFGDTIAEAYITRPSNIGTRVV